jgi:hypothetical protein
MMVFDGTFQVQKLNTSYLQINHLIKMIIKKHFLIESLEEEDTHLYDLQIA